MISLLANSSQVQRFLQLVILLPFVTRFIEMAEDTHEDGAAKRARVLKATKLSVESLEKAGYFTPEQTAGIDKTAGQLIDTIVSVYNAIGFFEHRPPAAEEPDPPEASGKKPQHTGGKKK